MNGNINQTHPLEVLYPKEAFGCILGEKGSRIKELRTSLHVKITSQKEQVRGGFRELRIEGDWVQQWAAFCEIAKTVNAADDVIKQDLNLGDANSTSDSARDSVSGGGNSKKTPNPIFDLANNPDKKFIIQIKLPVRITGSVIGKGGSNLNELRESFKDVAEIHVDNDNTDPNFRYLRIRANAQTLCDLAENVAEVMQTAYSKDTGGNDNADTKRRRLNGNQNSFSSPTDRSPYNNPKSSMGFSQMQQMMMNGNNNGGFNNSSPMSNNMSPAVSVPHAQAAQLSNQLPISGSPSSCVITLDNAACGKVIGPQGTAIKGIRQSTGCQVTTDKKGERADGHREIRIEGQMQAVLLAMQMISNYINQK